MPNDGTTGAPPPRAANFAARIAGVSSGAIPTGGASASTTAAEPAASAATTPAGATVTPFIRPQPGVGVVGDDGAGAQGFDPELEALDRRVAERLRAEGQTTEQPAEAGAQPEGGEQTAAPMLAGIPEADLLQQLRGAVTEDGNGFLLPAELAGRMFVTAKHNGQDVVIPMAEAARGIVRQNTLTQKEQALAQQGQQLEQAKQNLRNFFAGWDDQTGAGLAQSLEQAGVTSLARQALRSTWGTPEQPNVGGFIDDIKRSGHWGTFMAAANEYAANYAQQLQALMAGTANMTADARQQRRAYAEQVIAQQQQNELDMLRARVASEQQAEQLRRQLAKQQRDQELASQQQQAQGIDPRVQSELLALQGRAFKAFGLTPNPVVETYFAQFVQAITANATRNRETMTPEEIMARAAEATRDQLLDDRAAYGAQHQQQAPAAPAAATGLPARPIAAPAASAAAGIPGLPQRGGPSAFQQRIRTLQNAGQRR